MTTETAKMVETEGQFRSLINELNSNNRNLESVIESINSVIIKSDCIANKLNYTQFYKNIPSVELKTNDIPTKEQPKPIDGLIGELSKEILQYQELIKEIRDSIEMDLGKVLVYINSQL